MEAFWRKGYEATSLSDLCECTGLHKGSIYQTFGSKHELFMRALEHYATAQFNAVAAVGFQHDSPIENLRAIARKAIEDAMETGQGCMMVNSMVELGLHDDDVRALAERQRDMRLRVMTDLLRQAEEAGEINGAVPPERRARQLLVTMAGVSAASKCVLEPDEAGAVLDDVFTSWQ